MHPEFKNKGLGSEAVEYCIQLLINDNQIKILIVRTSQHAFKFFERQGFTLKEVQQNYWSEGLHLYLMQREI
jgi:ribosomal protein S18 acetylase RimI-like enzyme